MKQKLTGNHAEVFKDLMSETKEAPSLQTSKARKNFITVKM